MADLWQNNAAQFRERWGQLPAPRRKVYALSVIASVLAASLILVWAAQPRYTPLYQHLAPEDAGAIVEKLKGDKIAYRLTDGGATVEVPSAQVHELKMRMATAGLPQTSGPGWELFDKSPFGMTEFAQKLNYQRALQGELGRTIMQLAQVDSARVHLTIPEESLYEEEKDEPTASVVLALKGGRSLQRQEVQGILHLVSHAVPGMKPEHVALMDSRGNVLSTEDMASGQAISPEQTEAQLQMESRVERRTQDKIQAMLDKALGAGQAVVRVAARIDFSQRETNTETYTPAATGSTKGVLSEEHSVEEGYANRPGSPGQGSGLEANSGALPGLTAYRAAGGSAGGSYTHTEKTSRYNISKKTERTVIKPGQTTRLSVSIMLNGTLDQAKRDAVTQLATAAAGVDVARGDQVSVVGIPFDAKAGDEQKKMLADAGRQQMLSAGLRYGLVVLMMAFLLLIVRQVIRRPGVSSTPLELDGSERGLTPLESAPTVGQLLDEMEQSDTGEGALLGHEEPYVPVATNSPTEERLRRVATENPDFIARLLRSWLVEQPK